MPDEAVWVMIVKSILIFIVFLQIVPIILLGERKILGRFQSRIGPNRVGWRGVLQPAADVLKLLSKEAFTPATAVPWMAIAPVISVVTAVATMAIIPFGPVGAWGGDFGLFGMDVSIGILYFFAFGSLAFYGTMLGGWASGSKYSFLGAMRAAAQLISYEVALGLSLLGVVMTAGSMSLVDIVDAQDSMWFILPQFVGPVSASSWSPVSRRRRARRSTCPRATPRSSAATTPSSAACASLVLHGRVHGGARDLRDRRHLLPGWLARPGPDRAGAALDADQDPPRRLRLHVGARLAAAPAPDQLMSFGWKVLLPLATLNVLVTATVLVVT